MTPEQYERWKDFSRRMVNVARSARHRAPSRADTLEIIEFFFECRMGDGDPDGEWQRVESWDHTAKHDGDNSWGYPMCVSSHMSDIEEYHVPNYWTHMSDSKRDRLCEQWMGPAKCCVRAGLDLAVASSGGVVGFTAGDIRKMYPEGVPQWVKEVFDEPGELVALHATNISGIYHPETEPDARKFDDFPDDLGLWL